MEKIINIKGNEILIREAIDKESEKILSFLNFLFPHKKYNKEWFHWVREVKEYKRDYYCAYEGNKLVGIYGLFPVKVKLKEKIISASNCCNVGIEPKYWGSGLFEEISFYALESDKNKGRHFAFCSPRRPLAVKAHRRIGWQAVNNLLFYEKEGYSYKSIYKYERIDSFSKEQDIILEKFFHDKDFAVLKDSNYLNWRYKKNYYYFYSKPGEAILVLKEYEEKEKNIKNLHIMENFYTNDIESLLFNFILSIKKDGFKLNTWALENSNYAKILQKNSFKFNGTMCPFLIYPYCDKIKDMFLEILNPYFSLGDDEAF